MRPTGFKLKGVCKDKLKKTSIFLLLYVDVCFLLSKIVSFLCCENFSVKLFGKRDDDYAILAVIHLFPFVYIFHLRFDITSKTFVQI